MDLSRVQGTPEWLAKRKNYIMASDVPIIMKVSPWRTPFQLWEEKLNLSFEQKENFAMARGKEVEDDIRNLYIKLTGNEVKPDVIYHKSINYLGASLDGVTEDKKHAVEIKLANKEDHELAKKGIVPEKYYPQVQTQIEVLNSDSIDYFSALYSDINDTVLIKVQRDDMYLKKMISEVSKFRKCIETLSPPPRGKKDLETRCDLDWIEASKLWKEQDDIIKSLEQKIKEHQEIKDIAKLKLIDLSNDHSCIGGGISFKKIESKGRIQYDKIPQLKDVDLDIFRGETIVSYKIYSI